MYFLALAVDFDGTIARDGIVDAPTREALAMLKSSGRRLILVTGREQEDLVTRFPEYALFDRVVVENGAVLLNPSTGQVRMLAPPPNPALVEHLRRLGIKRLSIGKSVIAAWEPDQISILDAIRNSGLELQITFNKGAIMVLPTGVNKGSGLLAAAADLAVAPTSIVGVGDGENDHSFLSICGCSAAVANAVPSLKSEVDIVLDQDHGSGVVSLIAELQRLDADLLPIGRHGVDIGTDLAGKRVYITPHSGNVLVLGPSQSGKSNFCAMLIEQILDARLGLAVLDPEGDYVAVPGTTVLDANSTNMNLSYFEVLLAAKLNPVLIFRGVEPQTRQRQMRRAVDMAVWVAETTGSPSFLIIDEAHQGFAMTSSKPWPDHPVMVFVTLSADLLATDVLVSVGTICALGAGARLLLDRFCALAGRTSPGGGGTPKADEMLLWSIPREPIIVRPRGPVQGHIRHAGKYATGDLGPERSFYFRGKDNQICIAASNLFEFLKLGARIDDEIWSHHLYNGDMERWFSAVIRDPVLTDLATAIRHAPRAAAATTRQCLHTEIMSRYCLPVESEA